MFSLKALSDPLQLNYLFFPIRLFGWPGKIPSCIKMCCHYYKSKCHFILLRPASSCSNPSWPWTHYVDQSASDPRDGVFASLNVGVEGHIWHLSALFKVSLCKPGFTQQLVIPLPQPPRWITVMCYISAGQAFAFFPLCHVILLLRLWLFLTHCSLWLRKWWACEFQFLTNPVRFCLRLH